MKICRDWRGSHGLAYFMVPDGLEMKKIPFSGVLATWWNCVQAIVVRQWTQWTQMDRSVQPNAITKKPAQQDGNDVPSTSPMAPWTQVCKCQSLQSCPVLCNPLDCSPPGSTVHGISQAGVLEWAAISSYRGSSQPRDQTGVSCISSRFFTIWVTREDFFSFSFLNQSEG